MSVPQKIPTHGGGLIHVRDPDGITWTLCNEMPPWLDNRPPETPLTCLACLVRWDRYVAAWARQYPS